MTAARRIVVVLAACALLTAPVTAAPAGAALAPYPSSVAALGDSITRGFNAAGWFADWPSRSWATGTDRTVASHLTRIRAVLPAAVAYNDARTGAEMDELDDQARVAVSQQVEHVTVLMGANDACKGSAGAMTPVSTFRAELAAGLDVLEQQAPRPTILVASIPDLHRLWEVGKGSSAARTAWALYGICQSMLANPTSTQRADVDRRALVRQRVMDYNAVLQQECAAYQGTCRYDGGRVFGYRFTLSHLSTWDYFHPNTSGQAVLARETNAAGYQW